MPDIFTDTREFTGQKAWDARDIADIDGATVRLHWTDQPYQWHRNDGVEVFMVVEGAVDMRYRLEGHEKVVRLNPTDIFVAHSGDEHVAHPIGVARVLVIERKGSV